jgi:DDE_Tnp_1-associated
VNLIEAIKAVPDYRQARGIRHQLWLILTIVLLGSCTGYWGYKPLAEFTKNHRLLLIELFNLPLDIRFPSASTFRNVMMEMDFQAIASLFNIWAQQSLIISAGELFAVDGKSIKSTLIGGNKTCQDFVSIVSVYSHQQGWVVRHQAMQNKKTSEIGIVEQLVETLSGYQVVITADALHCQKKQWI